VIGAWWSLWAVAAASVATNWFLWFALRSWRRWYRAALMCSCGAEGLHLEKTCNHVDGWHHGPESCAPLHEGIHP